MNIELTEEEEETVRDFALLLLRKLAESTNNTLDDKAVDFIEGLVT